jgi:hypothetical protein
MQFKAIYQTLVGVVSHIGRTQKFIIFIISILKEMFIIVPFSVQLRLVILFPVIYYIDRQMIIYRN